MKPIFEWDEEKARTNLRKHKVSFEEAETVFDDPLSITISDPDHSKSERRFLDIGESENGRIIVVSYTQRGTRASPHDHPTIYEKPFPWHLLVRHYLARLIERVDDYQTRR